MKKIPNSKAPPVRRPQFAIRPEEVLFAGVEQEEIPGRGKSVRIVFRNGSVVVTDHLGVLGLLQRRNVAVGNALLLDDAA